ncbi:hypothetical protein ACPA9J_22020 [Pseudomonas aeruginosa]
MQRQPLNVSAIVVFRRLRRRPSASPTGHPQRSRSAADYHARAAASPASKNGHRDRRRLHVGGIASWVFRRWSLLRDDGLILLDRATRSAGRSSSSSSPERLRSLGKYTAADVAATASKQKQIRTLSACGCAGGGGVLPDQRRWSAPAS